MFNDDDKELRDWCKNKEKERSGSSKQNTKNIKMQPSECEEFKGRVSISGVVFGIIIIVLIAAIVCIALWAGNGLNNAMEEKGYLPSETEVTEQVEDGGKEVSGQPYYKKEQAFYKINADGTTSDIVLPDGSYEVLDVKYYHDVAGTMSEDYFCLVLKDESGERGTWELRDYRDELTTEARAKLLSLAQGDSILVKGDSFGFFYQ